DQLYLSRNLDVLLDRAEEVRVRMKDSYISVEHILLAFAEDDRIGRKLLKGFNADTAKLETTIKTVRGSQKVTDQTPESRYEALQKFGRDLTEQ
ncbi:MAG: Clp protease N-terminal domain-containing protein, partial [Nostoc sp.]